MALLTRLLALTGLSRLPWVASTRDPLAGPPGSSPPKMARCFKLPMASTSGFPNNSEMTDG